MNNTQTNNQNNPMNKQTNNQNNEQTNKQKQWTITKTIKTNQMKIETKIQKVMNTQTNKQQLYKQAKWQNKQTNQTNQNRTLGICITQNDCKTKFLPKSCWDWRSGDPKNLANHKIQ